MHDKALEFGGRRGILSQHGLESAISRPYSGYHRAISRKCAALMHSMIQNHPFTDGNKRTAWMLTEELLERIGYFLNEESEEAIEVFVVSIAKGELNFDLINLWFRERLRKT